MERVGRVHGRRHIEGALPACRHAQGVLSALMVLLGLSLGMAQRSRPVEVIRSVSGLAPQVVGLFRQPTSFQQGPDDTYYVFDRRAQRVYRISSSGEPVAIVEIGPEQGRIIGASSFDVAPNGRFVLADAPRGQERVQIFEADGTRIGGFTLPGRAAPRITIGNMVLNGVGSLQFTGQSVLMNQPESGGLITRYSLNGNAFHTFGVFRATGHEDDRDIHLALNSGIPLAAPDDSFYFVFQAGIPMFRKYDARGNLLFERHIEGPEIDPIVSTLPTTWPQRTDERGRQLPVIAPTVRTARVDREGHLWVGLTVPFLYVYDATGEKIRTIRLQGAGTIHADGLSFSNTNTLLVTPGCYEFDVW